MHRKYLLVLALPSLLMACGGTTIDSLRSGIPNSDTVRLDFPAQSGQALETGQTQQAALGQTSFFYGVTRDTTRLVNGATALVLILVKAITDTPPTTFKDNVAVWGPYTDALSPNTYRLTATDNGNHHYSYVLEGKAKGAPDTAYVTLLSGTHTAATEHGQPVKGFGNGTLLIDWDKAQTLPEHSADVGTALIAYSRMSSTAQVTIDVKFTQVRDLATNQRIDANYGYLSNPGADGRFRFSSYATPGAAIQRFAIESRWQNSGAGRADVVVTGGGLSQPATVNECWDASFKSQYLHASYDPSHDYGSESVCVFTPAEYSPL